MRIDFQDKHLVPTTREDVLKLFEMVSQVTHTENSPDGRWNAYQDDPLKLSHDLLAHVGNGVFEYDTGEQYEDEDECGDPVYQFFAVYFTDAGDKVVEVPDGAEYGMIHGVYESSLVHPDRSR